MHINKKNSDLRCQRTHRLYFALAFMAVLFSLSGCTSKASNSNTTTVITTTEYPASTDETVETDSDVSTKETTTSLDTTTAETSAETEGTTAAETESISEIPVPQNISSEVPLLPPGSNTSEESTSSPSTENSSEEFTQVVPETTTDSRTQAERNMELLNTLNNTYGLNIRYGNSADCKYGEMCYGITDETLVWERLSLLQECLSIYPVELFQDLKNQSPITINLVNTLHGADGYTNGSNSTNIQIALSCGNSSTYFKLAFHHELFHFIEYYMQFHYPDSELLIYQTETLQDSALFGTSDYTGTIYDGDVDLYHQYFVSVYAKTNAMEDRAETFSYYVSMTQRECMKVADSPITLKMKIIAEAIRTYCPSLAVYDIGTLPWESKITY